MPTYDYECLHCGHAFEEFHSIKAPNPPCPQCGRDVKRKIGTGAGLLFKGSGFYITDYRSESYKQASKAEKSGTTAASDKPKAESKPATKGSGQTTHSKTGTQT